jgi:LPXTG-motif cell wall-anchored protein
VKLAGRGIDRVRSRRDRHHDEQERIGMKRLGIAALAGVAFVLASAATAFAQSNIPPDVGGDVVQPPGAAPGSTAFTGANVTVWMVLVAVLVVLGIGFLLAARRRARTAQG